MEIIDIDRLESTPTQELESLGAEGTGSHSGQDIGDRFESIHMSSSFSAAISTSWESVACSGIESIESTIASYGGGVSAAASGRPEKSRSLDVPQLSSCGCEGWDRENEQILCEMSSRVPAQSPAWALTCSYRVVSLG